MIEAKYLYKERGNKLLYYNNWKQEEKEIRRNEYHHTKVFLMIFMTKIYTKK